MPEELTIVVRARDDAEKTIGKAAALGPQLLRTSELMRSVVAANHVQVAELQAAVQKIVESIQPQWEAMLPQIEEMLATFRKLREVYQPPALPSYLYSPPPSMPRARALENRIAQPIEPDAPADVQSANDQLAEMDWLLGEVLQENDALRLRIVRLRAELRGWKLDAQMSWGTLPYPDLDAEDFEEKQP